MIEISDCHFLNVFLNLLLNVLSKSRDYKEGPLQSKKRKVLS